MVDLQGWANWKTDSLNPALFNHGKVMMLMESVILKKHSKCQAMTVIYSICSMKWVTCKVTVSCELLGSKFLDSPASYRDSPTA